MNFKDVKVGQTVKIVGCEGFESENVGLTGEVIEVESAGY